MTNYIRPYHKLGHSGFTLLEILVAIAILSLVAIMVYSSFAAVTSANEIMDQRTKLNHTARFIIRTLTDDLVSASLMPNNISGVFKGEDSGGERQTDQVQFTSYGKKLSFQGSDQALIVWYVDDSDKDGLYTLLRGESFTATEFTIEDEKERAMLVTSELVSLNFRYLNNAEWKNSFDSIISNKLPKAVEISAELESGTGDTVEIKTLVTIGEGI